MKKHINYTQYESKNLGRIRCRGRNRVVPLQSLTPELWTLLAEGRHVVVRRHGIVLHKTSARTVRAALLPGCRWEEVQAGGYSTGWYQAISVADGEVIAKNASLLDDRGSVSSMFHMIQISIRGKNTYVRVFCSFADKLKAGDKRWKDPTEYNLQEFTVEPGRLIHKNGWAIEL